MWVIWCGLLIAAASFGLFDFLNGISATAFIGCIIILYLSSINEKIGEKKNKAHEEGDYP